MKTGSRRDWRISGRGTSGSLFLADTGLVDYTLVFYFISFLRENLTYSVRHVPPSS